MPQNEFVKMKIGGVYIYARDNEAREAIAQLQDLYDGLTESDIVVGALPASGTAKTIYRVPGTTSYSDYMWNGTEFVLMATYTVDTMQPLIGFFECSTEAAAAAKTIAAEGYVLTVGGAIKVKFTHENTALNPTLEINSQGAKPIIYEGEPASKGNSWAAGETVEVFYDGTNYVARSIDDTLASNIRSWAIRSALNVESAFSDQIRTVAGDESIDSSKGGKILSIVAMTDFHASAFKTTGYNLLHDAEEIGDGFYFEVPALPFGVFGTAAQPNGVLFTSSNENLKPTVRFKKLTDGIPESTADGSACSYTDSNNYRFYTSPEPGYMIVTGITFADTCAKIAWSRRYDDFISPIEATDGGTTIDLSPIFAWMHSDVNKMLVVGRGARLVSDRADRISDTQMKCQRYVGLATNLTWTNTPDEVEEGAEQTYTHSVVISGIKSDGLAELYSDSTPLTVNGTTVSYQDTNAEATEDYVKYELATQATSNVNVSSVLTLDDWGLEILVDATGSAIVTTQYAQGYPDAVAALVASYEKTLQVLVELIANLRADFNGMREYLKKMGDIAALSVDSTDGYTQMGQKVFDICDGAPQEYTLSTGLFRYDVTNSVLYVAKAVARDNSGWAIV